MFAPPARAKRLQWKTPFNLSGVTMEEEFRLYRESIKGHLLFHKTDNKSTVGVESLSPAKFYLSFR